MIALWSDGICALSSIAHDSSRPMEGVVKVRSITDLLFPCSRVYTVVSLLRIRLNSSMILSRSFAFSDLPWGSQEGDLALKSPSSIALPSRICPH